jgi:hypothetical protein
MWVLSDAGQFVTWGPHDVIVTTSVTRYVDVERTGTEGVVTTPAAVPSEYAGTVPFERPKEPVATAARVLIVDEEVATTPAAVLVEKVPEPVALVYDAKIAELADSASVTGQTVYRLLIICHKCLMIYIPCPL